MSKPIYSNTGNSTPWLSVIVPMYNAQAYVEQTIRSILSQTFQDYELLLVDDGSTDSTEEICTRYAAQDRRIRYLKKTKSIEEAGIWQIKYYMYYLEQKGVKNIKAKIDYPLLRETKEIILENEDRKILKNIIKNIEEISSQEKVPSKIDSPICKKCAYFDLCYV